jgi:hypothetical protein
MAWKGLAAIALAVGGLGAGVALAGEFPSTDRAYCDSNPPPDTYWGAGENRGDENRVMAGHDPAAGAVSVRNEGTDRHGLPFESNVSCDREEDTWTLFEANLGLAADSVRLAGVEQGMTIFGPVGAQIAAEVNLGPGQDDALGHAGKDRFDGGPGKDKLKTLGGRDKIFAADGAKDKIRCGSGRDKAIVDAKDNVGGDCERVKTL